MTQIQVLRHLVLCLSIGILASSLCATFVATSDWVLGPQLVGPLGRVRTVAFLLEVCHRVRVDKM